MPDMFLMTRLAFEPFLRSLVREHCPNVHFVSGTVIGINLDPLNASVVESVSYRSGGVSGTIEVQPAQLAIGQSLYRESYAAYAH
jgi:hypothetical protein